jgi:hypothetical protein
MSQTIITVSKNESASLQSNGGGKSGYRVDLAVVDAIGITPKIFVMQREVVSSGDSGDYEDQFYSVSSVSQLESIGETPSLETPFYRTDSISLMFQSVEDEKLYTDQILLFINKLRLANDLANTMTGEQIVGFPPEALPRFWGFSLETTITDEILLAGASDLVYSKALTKTLSITGAAKYGYLAIRESLGEIDSLTIGSVEKTTQVTTRDVEVLDGLSVSYRIYRTDNTTAAATSILFEAE